MDQNLKDADEALGLSPQEADLYKEHLLNLHGSGGVDNEDGSRSSLYSATVQGPDDRWYNIPTVIKGKKEVEPYTKPDGTVMDMPNQTAMDNVRARGWDRFPSYNSPEEADARYGDMHKFMEKDTGDYFAQKAAGAGRGRFREALEAPDDFGRLNVDTDAGQAPQGGGMGGYLRRLFHIESGGNPGAVTGSNRGLGQFGPAEERKYGITDANRRDPNVQAAAVLAERQENHGPLTRALGREPTDAEHYIAHQQGQAGASALFRNPNEPAWKAIRQFYSSDRIAKSAITGNIPSDSPLKRMNVDDISSQGFTAMWTDKFNRGGGAQAAGFIDPDAELGRQGMAQMPTFFPGRMAVKSDVSNFPQSRNIEDRSVPGPIQKIKDAANDTYMATRALLGLNPASGHGQVMNVKNPDDRLGSVKDIQDRVGVIRQRQVQMQETLKAAREEHEAATDEWFKQQALYHADFEKWTAESDRYLENLQKIGKTGKGKPGTLRPPPVDRSGNMPRYDEDLAAFKAYSKVNPD